MSQIGYMFLAAGIGAYANAMFHLMTHAFFKALLFLAAGIVIHALSGEQDMRKMGGLRQYLPRTYWAFLIGGLALTGIPPLSGFFSKDAILASALAAGTYGQILFVAGVIGAFLTGLYTFRMIFMVFGGEPSPYAREHIHRPERTEPWIWMAWTVAVLSLLAIIGGWVQIPGVWHPFANFLKPTVESLVEPTGAQEFVASVIALALGLLGIGVAWAAYSAKTLRIPRRRPRAPCSSTSSTSTSSTTPFSTAPPRCSRSRFAIGFEGPVVLGSITGIASGARRLAGDLSDVQTGLVRTYALAIAGSVTVLALVFVRVK